MKKYISYRMFNFSKVIFKVSPPFGGGDLEGAVLI